MYTEFIITMIIPAVGILVIFLFYRGWRWRIHRADVGGRTLEGSASAEADSPDAETGALQKQGDSLGDTRADAVALQGARNICAWLAIGWLFMVKQAPFQIRIAIQLLASQLMIDHPHNETHVPAGVHHPLPHDLPIFCLHGHRRGRVVQSK
jgi:hypothetical protein